MHTETAQEYNHASCEHKLHRDDHGSTCTQKISQAGFTLGTSLGKRVCCSVCHQHSVELRTGHSREKADHGEIFPVRSDLVNNFGYEHYFAA